MPKSKKHRLFNIFSNKKSRKLEVRDIKTRRLIYKTLKNNYMNYKESVWKKILTEDDWEKYIDENWLDKKGKRDHGGYITPSEMKKIGFNLGSKINLYQLLTYLRKSFKKRRHFDDSILPKDLPKKSIKDNITSIEIPTCTFNSKSYQKKYIMTLREFLLEFKNDILELDLSQNGGGKTEVIASGLLPLFLIQTNKVLAYLEVSRLNTRTKSTSQSSSSVRVTPTSLSPSSKLATQFTRTKTIRSTSLSNSAKTTGPTTYKKEILKIVDGEIYNLPINVKKAVKMPDIPKKIIVKMGNQTASAAEQIILALHVLRDVIDIKFTGNPTAGFTTWIDYINLPNGGAI